MKKLILILLLTIPVQAFCQNDYTEMTDLQKNICRITVNMTKDTTFFIDKLWYSERTFAQAYEEYLFISFVCDNHSMDLYFIDNELVGANIFFKKKDFKETVVFIEKNLFRVVDKKYKYKWVYANFDLHYLAVTYLSKKEGKITITLKS